MLKMTKVELEKISDVDIHLFIERGMRGGIIKRYSEANNKFCWEYDKTKLENFIFILIWKIKMEIQWVNIYHTGVLNWLKLIMKQ